MLPTDFGWTRRPRVVQGPREAVDASNMHKAPLWAPGTRMAANVSRSLYPGLLLFLSGLQRMHRGSGRPRKRSVNSSSWPAGYF